MISLEEQAKISNLVASCDELIAGKFILSEYKIAKIIKDIGESKEVYNLLAQCMQNFNFDKEFSRAQLSLPRKQFVLPDQPEKLLPFVFCLLMEINNKKINLNSFLNEYYVDGENDKFDNFANSVVKPFRNIIYNAFLVEEKQEEKQEEKNDTPQENCEENKTEDKFENFFTECENICKEILSEIEFERKRDVVEDVEYITETMLVACKDKNFKYLSALITAFGYVSDSVKSIRFLSRELRNILIALFEEE